MQIFSARLGFIIGLGALALSLISLTGCSSLSSSSPNPEVPFVFPGQAPGGAGVPVTPPGPPPSRAPGDQGATIRVGDMVFVNFSDIPLPGLPEHKQRVGEDGKLMLPYNVSVNAVGKTTTQLQEDIRNSYVPRLYKQFTATVRTEERFYYVGGEVRAPNRQPYVGEITVLRAIDTAQGFTDFSNRRNIEVRRANGQKVIVNWHKAIQDPKLDPPLYPNDQVIVHKKIL